MIELSPQITAPDTPELEMSRQKKALEKDNDSDNAFSRLIQGLLKKVKQIPGEGNARETIKAEKDSPSLTFFPPEMDREEGKEGLAALFLSGNAARTAETPRKAEKLPGQDSGANAVQAEIRPGDAALKSGAGHEAPEGLLTAAKAPGQDNDAGFTGPGLSLPESGDASFSPEEIPADDALGPLMDDKSGRTALVDFLAAKRDETQFRESHSGRNPKALLADAVKDQEAPPEGKVRDKRKERINLEVQDQRSQAQGEVRNEKAAAPGENQADFSADAEIVVELRDPGSRKDESGLVRENRNAQTFQDLLSRELRDGLNTEIVRHASLVLRENGEGLIKLSLRPENLGNIKIRLEMADNKVTGHIILETDEALKAFEKEIRSLEQAFKDSGFDSASLEMTLSSGQGEGGAGQQWRGEEAGPFFSERFAVSSYEALVDYEIRPEAGLNRNGNIPQVNMLV